MIPNNVLPTSCRQVWLKLSGLGNLLDFLRDAVTVASLPKAVQVVGFGFRPRLKLIGPFVRGVVYRQTVFFRPSDGENRCARATELDDLW